MARVESLPGGRADQREHHGPATVSLGDNLLFLLGFAIPVALQGAFTRSRRWVSFFSRWQLDPAAIRFVRRIRRRGGDHFWIRLGTSRALLILDPPSIARVLDRSPGEFADGEQKRSGMRHFQPWAVTISRGEEWLDRRRFNEAVLATGTSPHPSAQRFLDVVRAEIAPSRGAPPRLERWDDFDLLFRRIMLEVIFGQAARTDDGIADALKRLLREANRPPLLRMDPSPLLEPFFARIRAYLDAPGAGSLAERCHETSSTPLTRVESQVPHWMFAAWETLAINTVRALALVLSHPDAERRVREEMSARDLGDADEVDELGYLEACLQEAMRLWTTTPVLVREAVADTVLGGTEVPKQTQIVILSVWHHRDPSAHPAADRFAPELWANGRPPGLALHFGGGGQVCAGRELALFIGKAVLATLLQRGPWRLVGPRLDPLKPIPHTYDPFRIRFSVGTAPTVA